MATPLDGRLTSFTQLSGQLNGGELMYIVSPGNAAQGNSYAITTSTLAAFFSSYPFLNSELITSGATAGMPYSVSTTDTRVLFDKVLSSASYAVCPPAASMIGAQEVLFKDVRGTASTYNITISFSSGELCDGLSEIQITTNYGWVGITPVPGGGAWYQSR